VAGVAGGGGSGVASGGGGGGGSLSRVYTSSSSSSTPAEPKAPSLFEQAFGLVRDAPAGLAHFLIGAATDPGQGALLGGMIGGPWGAAIGGGVGLVGAGVERVIGGPDEPWFEESQKTLDSLKRTGSNIIHPSRYLDAIEQGTILPTLVEDVGNVTLIATPALKHFSTAARAEATTARLALNEADDVATRAAARTVEAAAAHETAKAAFDESLQRAFQGGFDPAAQVDFLRTKGALEQAASALDEANTAQAAARAALEESVQAAARKARPYLFTNRLINDLADAPFTPYRLALKAGRTGLSKVHGAEWVTRLAEGEGWQSSLARRVDKISDVEGRRAARQAKAGVEHVAIDANAAANNHVRRLMETLDTWQRTFGDNAVDGDAAMQVLTSRFEGVADQLVEIARRADDPNVPEHVRDAMASILTTMAQHAGLDPVVMRRTIDYYDNANQTPETVAFRQGFEVVRKDYEQRVLPVLDQMIREQIGQRRKNPERAQAELDWLQGKDPYVPALEQVRKQHQRRIDRVAKARDKELARFHAIRQALEATGLDTSVIGRRETYRTALTNIGELAKRLMEDTPENRETWQAWADSSNADLARVADMLLNGSATVRTPMRLTKILSEAWANPAAKGASALLPALESLPDETPRVVVAPERLSEVERAAREEGRQQGMVEIGEYAAALADEYRSLAEQAKRQPEVATVAKQAKRALDVIRKTQAKIERLEAERRASTNEVRAVAEAMRRQAQATARDAQQQMVTESVDFESALLDTGKVPWVSLANDVRRTVEYGGKRAPTAMQDQYRRLLEAMGATAGKRGWLQSRKGWFESGGYGGFDEWVGRMADRLGWSGFVPEGLTEADAQVEYVIDMFEAWRDARNSGKRSKRTLWEHELDGVPPDMVDNVIDEIRTDHPVKAAIMDAIDDNRNATNFWNGAHQRIGWPDEVLDGLTDTINEIIADPAYRETAEGRALLEQVDEARSWIPEGVRADGTKASRRGEHYDALDTLGKVLFRNLENVGEIDSLIEGLDAALADAADRGVKIGRREVAAEQAGVARGADRVVGEVMGRRRTAGQRSAADESQPRARSYGRVAAGAAKQAVKIADMETQARMLGRRIGLMDQQIEGMQSRQIEALAAAADAVDNAPARYRPLLNTARDAVALFTDAADAIDAFVERGDADPRTITLAAADAEFLRSQIAGIATTLSEAVAADLDPLYVPGGMLPRGLGDQTGGGARGANTSPAAGGQVLPTERALRFLHKSEGRSPSGSIRNVAEVTLANIRQAIDNETVMRIENLFGKSLADLLADTDPDTGFGHLIPYDEIKGRRLTLEELQQDRYTAQRRLLAENLTRALADRGLYVWNPDARSSRGVLFVEGVENALAGNGRDVATTFALSDKVVRELHKFTFQGGNAELWARRHIDPIHRVWKHGVLALKPQWQVGNIVGNSVMAMVGGGFSPGQYRRALAQARAVMSGTLTPELARELGIPDKAIETMIYEAQAAGRRPAKVDGPDPMAAPAGLIRRGMLDMDVARETAAAGDYGVTPEGRMDAAAAELERTRGEGFPTFRSADGKVHPIQFSYELNGYFDDMSRVASWLMHLDRQARDGLTFAEDVARARAEAPDYYKGMTDDDVAVHAAMTLAVRTQGDFLRMRPWERSLARRILPFYPWIKHITKLTGRLAADHPLRLLWTMRLGALMADEDRRFQYGMIETPWGFLDVSMNYNPFETPFDMVASRDGQQFSPAAGFLRSTSPLVQAGMFAFGFDANRGGFVTRPGSPMARGLGMNTSPDEWWHYMMGYAPYKAREAVPQLLFGHDPVARYGSGDPILNAGDPFSRRHGLWSGEVLDSGRPALLSTLYSQFGLPTLTDVDVERLAGMQAEREASDEAARRRYAAMGGG